jgi:endonuclease/exonuclease/phosphatase family metal-dependent hydrolase
MAAVKLAALMLALGSGACSMSGSPDQPWVPLDEVTGALAPELVQPRNFAAPTGGTLRLVTYNVEYAPDVPALADAIRNEPSVAKGDVFFIQEIESYPDEGASRASRLADELALGYVYVPARLRDTGTHGLAILSRYPIRNVQRMDLPDMSQTVRHRIAISADIDLGGTLVSIIDLHLETKLDPQERIAQLHPAVIDAPDAVIIAGDFNMSWVEWVNGVPILAAGADQAPIVDSYMSAQHFETPAADSGPTEHMFGIEQRLDAIYPRGYALTFGGVPRVGPSDHWPMWADVSP